HLAGVRFNDLVKNGDVVAPIVLGRDHLDCGSVASPYRETESMADGSDAIADWPLLNALVNTSSGASWVSIHHGGGVGIGRAIHAGQVCVADGPALACRDWFHVAAAERGLREECDRNGNLWAWWDAGDGADAVGGACGQAIATGSHLDSVPDGGAFDGPLGVVSAFAAIDLLRERGF